MKKRTQQRIETRGRIVDAAAETFAELGFKAASTREIAKRADTNQGLITYHFKSKDELWKAAADQIFTELRDTLEAGIAALDTEDPKERAREQIREYVRFAAAHPELFRMMVEEGKRHEDRMQWLVDTHMRPMYERAFSEAGAMGVAGLDQSMIPHLHYALAGAGSLIFAVAPECRRLTGVDPTDPEVVEAHADFVARLLVPQA